MKKYILSLDCGTTGNRAIAFDQNHHTVASSYREFKQHYPKPGWVEHDALEIWNSVLKVSREVVKRVGVKNIAAIGITNQRETVVVWNKKTGKPVGKAVVWQCRRTTDLCEKLKKRGLEKTIHQKTGLFLDPYFSATKIQWLMQHSSTIRSGLRSGKLICGTIDAWVIWKLTGGKGFSTDPTNASRTLLYNLKTGAWDKSLCKLFGVPMNALPEVLPSSCHRGDSSKKFFGASIPITGVAGDQQASAFAQGCSPKGIVKNTYGTGLFVVAEMGPKIKITKNLVTTVAASEGKALRYALEGSIFIGGAAMQWLRDGLGIIKTAKTSEKEAKSLSSNEGVYFVPALVGLGCPHWDPKARGTIVGITRQTSPKHFIRAALESMAYQTRDVLDLVKKETGFAVKTLRVDGGAIQNNFLMQFQSDILRCRVERPVVGETTALGAAALAGIACGVWKNQKHFLKKRRVDRVFTGKMDSSKVNQLYQGWLQAVDRTLL